MTSAAEPRIRTRLAGNFTTCRFELDRPLREGGAVIFRDKDRAEGSALARELLGLADVKSVKIGGSYVWVTRGSFDDWPAVARKVADLLRGSIRSGRPAVDPGLPSNMPPPEEIRRRAEEVLEAQINPAVAAHGGVISLVDVKDATLYVRLGGGCQGCGMALMTLKQGVERAFREAIPELDEVLDVTDHAAGANPYHSPSR